LHSRVQDQQHQNHVTLVTSHTCSSNLTPAHHQNTMTHSLHQVKSPEPELS